MGQFDQSIRLIFPLRLISSLLLFSDFLEDGSEIIFIVHKLEFAVKQKLVFGVQQTLIDGNWSLMFRTMLFLDYKLWLDETLECLSDQQVIVHHHFIEKQIIEIRKLNSVCVSLRFLKLICFFLIVCRSYSVLVLVSSP